MSKLIPEVCEAICSCSFFFGYLVNRDPHSSVSTLRKNELLQESLIRICDLRVQSTCGYKNPGVRVQYACTILMMKLAYAYKVKYTLAFSQHKKRPESVSVV